MEYIYKYIQTLKMLIVGMTCPVRGDNCVPLFPSSQSSITPSFIWYNQVSQTCSNQVSLGRYKIACTWQVLARHRLLYSVTASLGHALLISQDKLLLNGSGSKTGLTVHSNLCTVDSRYLEFQGTL